MATSLKTLTMTTLMMMMMTSTFSLRMTTNIKGTDLIKRQKRGSPNEHRPVECVDMIGTEGHYWHTSNGSDVVCGLYVIGDADTLVQLEILHFDIGCEDNGLMAVVDGWEMKGDLFPSPDDVEGGLEAQYQTFCGPSPPPSVFLASQNVALVQFRVPTAGQGFRVRVRFLRNPEPCNVLAPNGATIFTMRNFAKARNCTTLVLYPVNLRLLSADVRATSSLVRPRDDVISGLSVNCNGALGSDFVSLLWGYGLDTGFFYHRMAFCGRRSVATPHSVTLGCASSAVQLQSTGVYDNSVVFQVSEPSLEELEAFRVRLPQCPAFN